MQFVMLMTIVVVTTVEFLTTHGLLPAPLELLPEVSTAIVTLYVLVVGIRRRFENVRAPYWLLFGALLMTVLFGLIANHVGAGPTVAGVRRYVRAIPLFFLPAAASFSESQIRTQLRLLLALSLIQLPLAVSQRLTVFREGRFSGDDVSGTLLISSIMSMFLICGACILTGFVLRRQISKSTFVLLFLLLLIPTTINETKATVLLLPIGLLAAFLTGSERSKRVQVVLTSFALLAVFGSIYVPVYDYFNTRNNPYPSTISEFFTQKKVLERYVDTNAALGTRKEPGRVDAIVVPLAEIAHRDPAQLLLGVGIGNASHSSLGHQFTGAYNRLFGRYVETSTGGALLVEIGLIGTSLVLLLYWLVFRDASIVARSDPGIIGAIAIGWTGATLVLAIGTFYKTIHVFDSLGYMFWYFSGLIAARRMELALATAREQAIPHPVH